MDFMNDVLIVSADYYKDISNQLFAGAENVLADQGLTVKKIEVPGVFEIPSVVAKAWVTKKYLGVITLGCVIRGATDHYEYICGEVSRELMELTVKLSMPHGFGILTCENYEQALERASINDRNSGGRAAIACCQVMEIHKKIDDGSL